MPGRYAESLIESFEAKYGNVKVQNVPCGDEAQEISNAVLLPPDEASLYRSLVGSGIYLSQERIELGYVIKQLASGMSSPSMGHLQVMKRFIGLPEEDPGQLQPLEDPELWQGHSSQLRLQGSLSHSRTQTGQATDRPGGAPAVVFML